MKTNRHAAQPRAAPKRGAPFAWLFGHWGAAGSTNGDPDLISYLKRRDRHAEHFKLPPPSRFKR
ncbi:MAG: hypothetical protein K6T75_06570 [Acetobacteraceae bacterium]|nr:hypothetical protein [Acetobacteraceae bacterium]